MPQERLCAAQTEVCVSLAPSYKRMAKYYGREPIEGILSDRKLSRLKDPFYALLKFEIPNAEHNRLAIPMEDAGLFCSRVQPRKRAVSSCGLAPLLLFSVDMASVVTSRNAIRRLAGVNMSE